MEIQRQETGEQGKFYIEETGKKIALMTYRKSGEGVMTIDHTEVDSNRRGKSIGEDLVAEAVKFARENDLKIVPTCSFAKSEFEKHEDYADVLAE